MKLRQMVIVVSILANVGMAVGQHTGVSYTSCASDIEKLWAGAVRLAKSGDSIGAVREIERVECLSKEKYTSFRETEEWMSIKAELYAFNLHNLDSAYDIQSRAAELMLKSKDHWLLSTASRKAYSYAFLRGWLQMAYAHALVSHIEEGLSSKERGRDATLSCESLVRASLSLRYNKEALSYATWMANTNYKNFQTTKNDFKYYAFFPLAKSIGYQMDAQINMGYYDDAERILNHADSLADSINKMVDSKYFHLDKSKYLLFPRIRLLTIQQKYDEALQYAQFYKPGWDISLFDHLHLFYDVQFHLLMADIYHGQGKLQEEKTALDKAAYCLNEVNPNHPYMVEILCRYAQLISSEEQIAAINILGSANKILKDCYLDNSSFASDVFEQVIKCGRNVDALKKLWPKWILQITVKRFEQLRKEFAECTFNEQIHFWNHGGGKEWFEHILPQMVCEDKEMMVNDTVIQCAFAGIQVYKNLLFNSECRMRQLLESDKNRKLLRDYNRLIGLKQQLLRQDDELVNNYRDLKTEIYQLDDNLRYKLNLHDDLMFKENISLNNQFVKQIAPGELYIDFIRYRSVNGKMKYAAFMVKRGEKRVEALPLDLFEENELKAIPSEELYSSPRLYDLIWKRFEQPIKKLGITRIYFSAVGDLHNLAIENVPDSKGETICDKCDVARVMSVKGAILAQKKGKAKKFRNVSLWGNMDFQHDTIVASVFGQPESLPYSRLELKTIRRSLPQHVRCSVYEGSQATEEAFKLQDSKGLDILHLATHGFYWDGNLKNQDSWLTESLSEIFNPRTSGSLSEEDQSMMNSFLLFSKLQGESEDDGILTASEVAMMDFSTLDLVVLSACKTGLGDMSSEGTLGLQRAFKKAGAKSMLISLKSIHDESTYLLMTFFYRELFTGKTKHEALHLAQEKVKTVHDGIYAHPNYWAPFILVDAFD